MSVSIAILLMGFSWVIGRVLGITVSTASYSLFYVTLVSRLTALRLLFSIIKLYLNKKPEEFYLDIGISPVVLLVLIPFSLFYYFNILSLYSELCKYYLANWVIRCDCDEESERLFKELAFPNVTKEAMVEECKTNTHYKTRQVLKSNFEDFRKKISSYTPTSMQGDYNHTFKNAELCKRLLAKVNKALTTREILERTAPPKEGYKVLAYMVNFCQSQSLAHGIELPLQSSYTYEELVWIALNYLESPVIEEVRNVLPLSQLDIDNSPNKNEWFDLVNDLSCVSEDMNSIYEKLSGNKAFNSILQEAKELHTKTMCTETDPRSNLISKYLHEIT